MSTPSASPGDSLRQAKEPVFGGGGGNGRNIGLGLLARDPHLSQKPRTPDDEADGAMSFEDKLSSGAQIAGRACDIGRAVQPSDASTSASSTAAAGNGAKLPKPAHNERDKFVKLKSRSSRLLLEAEPDEDEEETEDYLGTHGSNRGGHGPLVVKTNSGGRSPLQRRKSAVTMSEHKKSAKDPQVAKQHAAFSSLSAVSSALYRSLTYSGTKNNYDDDERDPPKASESSGGFLPSPRSDGNKDAPHSMKSKLLRRNSQYAYAESAQTAIIFDWDDTLFPTSYFIDDLRLNPKRPLAYQRLSKELMDEVVQSLKELEAAVEKLLELANKKGKLILVTLARSPWIDDSCRNFYPNVGEKIRRLNIKVVYAQEGVQVDYDKRRMMNDSEVERMYSEMKGKAISREVDAFYSQYEGQSWKNIISIGDSDFERLGTIMMSKEYMKSMGLLSHEEVESEDGVIKQVSRATNEAFRHKVLPIEVNGHMYKVRTKTFKMLDCPTIGELKEEVDLIQRWLPKMVALDDGFDADLSALDDPKLLENIERVLTTKRKKEKGRGR